MGACLVTDAGQKGAYLLALVQVCMSQVTCPEGVVGWYSVLTLDGLATPGSCSNTGQLCSSEGPMAFQRKIQQTRCWEHPRVVLPCNNRDQTAHQLMDMDTGIRAPETSGEPSLPNPKSKSNI